MTDRNSLYYGDNLDVLKLHVPNESADLIYLDPPFNSNKDYNVLFAEQDGSRAAAQIKAFEDTWRWDEGAARSYQEVVEQGGSVSGALRALRTFLGESDMLAYLSMMAPRLVELKRVLKPTGAIYLHCDPTASHYLKMLMDATFGPAMFRNEIIWHYSGWNAKLTANFNSRHDVLLYYSKSKNTGAVKFNSYTLPWESEEEYVKVRKQKIRLNGDGKKYVLSDAGGGKRVKRYLSEAMAYGKPVDDVWEIDKLNNSAKEALGYPTQKPEALLDRIILAGSDPGDLVIDPFCGCGTAVAVAQRLGRSWTGIDITHLAISLIRNRLRDAYGDGIAKTYSVVGEPVTVEDAEMLAAESDKYQFQWWALGLVGARPVSADQKKGSDRGIDGKLFFHDDKSGDSKQVLSVKAGQLQPSYLRDLRGVIDREQAEIGVLISMEEPTKAMRTEAASAGFYVSQWGTHPKLQLRTVAELLAGKGIDYPPTKADSTFKKAPRVSYDEPIDQELPLEMVAERPEPPKRPRRWKSSN